MEQEENERLFEYAQQLYNASIELVSACTVHPRSEARLQVACDRLNRILFIIENGKEEE